MKQQQQISPLFLNLIPTWGIIIFAILFYYSSTLYPGGSQESIESEGFDWIHNYWCNLMNNNAMNGLENPARPIAISAMFILCISISIFFYQFAEYFTQHKVWKKMIQLSGICSMVFAAMMFTNYHDLMTILSSLSGVIAVIGIIKEIYVSPLIFFKLTGATCIILLGINNLIYYSTELIEWLPLIQKITFLVVLLWILGVNNELRKKMKTDFRVI